MRHELLGPRARRANPALLPLSFLLGHWSTNGTHLMLPGHQLLGATDFAWMEGGAYLVMRSQVDHEELPDGMAIFSSDSSLHTILLSWFDERGVSRVCPVSVTGNSVSWYHDDPKFMQRVTITAEESRNRMVSEGTMAKNGGPWGPDPSQVFLRR